MDEYSSRLNEKDCRNGDLNHTTDESKKNHDSKDALDFDEFLDEIGGFGPRQRAYFFTLSSSDIFGAFAIMISIFVGATPKWQCAEFETGGNATYYDEVNITFSYNDTLYKCETADGRQCIKYEFIDDFTSLVSEFNLVCGQSYVVATIRTLQMFGVWLGSVTCSQLSDTFGRKRTFYGILSTEILAGCIASFSVNWQMYAVCRFVIGFGFGGVTSVGVVYPMEFVGRKWRTLIGTVSLWAIGVMLLSLFGYFIRDWRLLMQTTTFTGLPFLATYLVIPESPRWLIERRRYKEAKLVLTKFAHSNGKAAVTVDKMQLVVDENEGKAVGLCAYSYFDLFKQRAMVRTTVIMIFVWFDIVISYYIMTYNMDNLAGNRYLNMFLFGLTEYPAMISTFFLGNWLGRRITYNLYAFITAFCCLFIIIANYATIFQNVPVLTTILVQITRACASGGMLTLMFYTPELFPTVVRNSGLGAAYFSGRLAGMIAPQIVVMASTVYKLIPYFVVLVLTIVTAPMLFCLPETNGRPLEDSLRYDKTKRQPNAPDTTSEGLLSTSTTKV